MADCSRKGFGILCLSNSMTVTRLERLKKEYGFYPDSITEIYVRSWGLAIRLVSMSLQKFLIIKLQI